jgi:hypothetical protein
MNMNILRPRGGFEKKVRISADGALTPPAEQERLIPVFNSLNIFQKFGLCQIQCGEIGHLSEIVAFPLDKTL